MAGDKPSFFTEGLRLAKGQANLFLARGSISALCKAFHKADYAKHLIMERGGSERMPNAVWLRQAGIPTFA